MIAIASDHAGFPLKEEIKKFLIDKFNELFFAGTKLEKSVITFYATNTVLFLPYILLF